MSDWYTLPDGATRIRLSAVGEVCVFRTPDDVLRVNVPCMHGTVALTGEDAEELMHALKCPFPASKPKASPKKKRGGK